jgi:hypothetical protein
VRWDHIWRSAFFLAILRITRAECSTTRTPSALSSLNMLCLTNATFLVSKTGPQSLSTALSHPAHPLTLLSTFLTDNDLLLAAPELSLPHLEGEEPVPGHADVPAYQLSQSKCKLILRSLFLHLPYLLLLLLL